MDLAVSAAQQWAPESERAGLEARVADAARHLVDVGVSRQTALRALVRTAASESDLDALLEEVGDDVDLQWYVLERRAQLGTLDTEAMQAEIRHAVEVQERLGLDVLVHGEAERNDMVEYFAEQLSGYAFTRFGWVQSYGSRCVKPAVIVGDLSRPKAMTVAVVMAGLLPILLGHGTGSEVMTRIAAPMVGGMVTAPLLSMLVVPAAW